MTNIQVFIATTQGPSRIQRIAEEDANLRSVICVNGTTQALSISAAYDSFVRKPTGVIERHFGHPVYRMDVSIPIDEGRSWQLGAYLAHVAFGAKKLGDQGICVWATGEIDHTLSIKPVDHIVAKIQASKDLFVEAHSKKQSIRLILHPDNAKIVTDDILADHNLTRENILVTDHADIATDAVLGRAAKQPIKVNTSNASQSGGKSGRKMGMGVLAFGLVLLLGAGFGLKVWTDADRLHTLQNAGNWQQLSSQMKRPGFWNKLAVKAFVASRKSLSQDALNITITALVPDASIRFGGGCRNRKALVERTYPLADKFKASKICGLVYTLNNQTDKDLYVWGRVKNTKTSGGLSKQNKWQVANHLLKPGAKLMGKVRTPPWQNDSEIQAFVAAALMPSDTLGSWLKAQGSKAFDDLKSAGLWLRTDTQTVSQPTGPPLQSKGRFR